MNTFIPSLLPPENEALFDFEITCGRNGESQTYVVRGCKTPGNAMASFERSVPDHGPIRRVRKVGG